MLGIASKMNVESNEIDLSRSDIEELISNQRKTEYIGVSKKKIEDREKVKKAQKDIFLELATLKVETGIMQHEDITKEDFEDVIKIKESIFDKSRQSEELVEILKNDNYLREEYDKKIKEYSKTFDGIFKEFEEKYARSVTLEDMDEKTMKAFYENNYQGKFQNPEIQNMYNRYCQEQEKNSTIQEQDKTIEEQANDIKEKDETIKSQSKEIEKQDGIIGRQSEELTQKEKTIQDQNGTIEEQNKLIATKDEEIANKDKKIKQFDNDKKNAEKEIGELKARISALEKQNLALKDNNSMQLMVIDGLEKRTKFLENIVNMQKKFIDSMMQKFNGVKNSVHNVIDNMKPKTFVERIAARFTRKKDSVINEQTENIEKMAIDAIQDYKKVSMVSGQSKQSSEDYINDYMQQSKSQNEPVQVDEKTMDD